MTMNQPLTRELVFEAPLNLRRTLGKGYGPRDPTTSVDSEGLWRTSINPQGAVTLQLNRHAERITARAWGPGAAHQLEQMESLLGFDDEPDALEPKHALIGQLKRRFAGLRLGRGRNAVEVLIGTIIGQRVTVSEAQNSYRRLVWQCGQPAPGPKRMQLPADPKSLKALPIYAFHRFGIEQSRARTILEVCHHPRFVGRIANLDPKEAVAHLCKLPGVGPWTANITVATVLGWADAVPTGDYHIPNHVAWALAGEPRGDDARMLELLEPYRGQRWRVLRLLGAAKIKAPKRGPKRAGWATQVQLASERLGD